MKPLPILWQRLVSPEGKTCDRCSATHQEMERAVAKLKQSLRPLGIEPRLEITEIDEKSFKANPSESNRIWIARTSIAMIQDHYGRYIRDDGDALLRAYVEQPKLDVIEEKTGTFAETFESQSGKYLKSVVVPTGIEPVFPT